MSFFEYKCDNRLYLKSDLLENCKVTHGFTSRLGGVSQGTITGFNLGFRVGDDENSVRENYRLLSCDLGFSLDRAVLSKQTHTDNIRIVKERDCGKGIVRQSDIEDTDGLVTNIRNMALVVFSADCVPILMYDKKAKVAAAIHAGWRGSVKKIAAKCVDIMKREFSCNPSDIVAAIGPSIGKCCFEFGEDAVIYFDKKYYTKIADGKYKIDLWSFNRDQLTESGVLSCNIDISGVCTMCQSDRFYSYRAHKEKTGRQAAVIIIKD